MKKLLLCVCLVMPALIAHAGQTSNTDAEANLAAAKMSIQAFAASLQTELKTAMQAGGPVAGVAVCNTKAMEITGQAANAGMELSRVSLRNRNPGNAPNAWQTAVLEDFEGQKLAGRDVTELAWSETVDIDGSSEFRFMKAIPTGEVCLKCHGTTLAPGVAAVLSELYPQDKATGYKQGDIRGAFVAVRKLPN